MSNLPIGTVSAAIIRDRLAEIRERAKLASPGPWVWVERYDYHELTNEPEKTYGRRIHSDGTAGGEYSPDIDVHGPDGLFMAHARADVPFLLELLDLFAEGRDLWAATDERNRALDLLADAVQGKTPQPEDAP